MKSAGPRRRPACTQMPAMPLQSISAALPRLRRLAPRSGAGPAAGGTVLALAARRLGAAAAVGARRRRGGAAASATGSPGSAWGCMGLFSSLFVLTLVRDVGLLPSPRSCVRPGRSRWRRCGAAAPRRSRSPRFVTPGASSTRAAPRRVGASTCRSPACRRRSTASRSRRSATSTSARRSSAPTSRRSSTPSTGSTPTWSRSPATWSTAPCASSPTHIAPLAGLRSRHGIFFVTGNHEYYSGADAWVAELRRLGLRVLINEHVVVRRGDAALVVAGVTDYSAAPFRPRPRRSDPRAALAGAPGERRVRCCSRTSRAAPRRPRPAGFDLQLSGHTHGGQFLPWNFFVRLQQPFTAGLHRWRRCGSTPAAAPATGGRRSASARRPRSPSAPGRRAPPARRR